MGRNKSPYRGPGHLLLIIEICITNKACSFLVGTQSQIVAICLYFSWKYKSAIFSFLLGPILLGIRWLSTALSSSHHTQGFFLSHLLQLASTPGWILRSSLICDPCLVEEKDTHWPWERTWLLHQLFFFWSAQTLILMTSCCTSPYYKDY